jgi:hypothetical protein
MTPREAFEATCRGVCEERGWGFSGTRIELKFESGRHQLVELEFFDFEGEELVRLFSRIGSVKHMHPMRLTDALRLNFGLPHGALAVKDDELVVIDTLLVEGADAEEVEVSVRYLAETADHFERTMFGVDEH